MIKSQKKLLTVIFSLVLFVCALFGAVACKEEETQPQTSEFSFTQQDFTLILGDNKQLAVKGDNPVWSSSDEAIVTVDENGLVTSVALGSAEITVKCGKDEGKCLVTVVLSSIIPTVQMDERARALDINTSYTLAPSLVYKDEVLTDGFVFASSNSQVVTVSQSGEVTAVGYGTAEISISWNYRGYTDTTKISFTVKEPITLVLNEKTLDLVVDTLTTTSENKMQSAVSVKSYTIAGEAQDASTLVWMSEDETVAKVENGTVKAIGVGETKIVATATTANGTTVTASVSVSVYEEALYTIKYYYAPANGEYREITEKTQVKSDIIGKEVSVEQDALDGFIFNTARSFLKATVAGNGETELSQCFDYDSTGDAEFARWTLGGKFSLMREDMDASIYGADAVENVFVMESPVAGTSYLQYNYKPEEVGCYLVFNFYFTESVTENNAIGDPLINMYQALTSIGKASGNYKQVQYPNNTDTKYDLQTGAWMQYVLYIDETKYPAQLPDGASWMDGENKIRMNFFYNRKGKVYFDFQTYTKAEYAVMDKIACTASSTAVKQDMSVAKFGADAKTDTYYLTAYPSRSTAATVNGKYNNVQSYKYQPSDVGKYLIVEAYYAESTNSAGESSIKFVAGSGKKQIESIAQTAETGKWLTYAIFLDESTYASATSVFFSPLYERKGSVYLKFTTMTESEYQTQYGV